TKLQYIALAQRIANVIYSTDAVPTYVTSDLGTMNYCNMIYMFSGILKFYLAYGFLPDTMDVQPWGAYDFQNK
ncbi:MAG: hypothetical protein IJF80_03810, partial [Clostridia bacterium]|nr:hypothetical protein [Clostridia bacterium]